MPWCVKLCFEGSWNNIKVILRRPPLLFISVQLSGKAKVSAVLCESGPAAAPLRTLLFSHRCFT